MQPLLGPGLLRVWWDQDRVTSSHILSILPHLIHSWLVCAHKYEHDDDHLKKTSSSSWWSLTSAILFFLSTGSNLHVGHSACFGKPPETGWGLAHLVGWWKHGAAADLVQQLAVLDPALLIMNLIKEEEDSMFDTHKNLWYMFANLFCINMLDYVYSTLITETGNTTKIGRLLFNNTAVCGLWALVMPLIPLITQQRHNKQTYIFKAFIYRRTHDIKITKHSGNTFFMMYGRYILFIFIYSLVHVWNPYKMLKEKWMSGRPPS